MNFLFVCTGNTCRSPMAMVIARRMLEKLGKPDCEVRSAGVFAEINAVANELAIEAVNSYDARTGEMLKAHRAVQVDRDIVLWADYILVMSEEHGLTLVGMFNGADDEQIKKRIADKITVLRIPDPFGGDVEFYEKTRDWLIALIEDFLEGIFDNPETIHTVNF